MKDTIVCLIEDDDAYLFLAKAMIKSVNSEIQIISFKDGREAMAFFSENYNHAAVLPHVIFLDLNMPGMDGWHFLDEYAKLENKLACPIPIYILSSSIAEKDLNRAAKNKLVTAYIEKPLPKEQFTDIIKLRILTTN